MRIFATWALAALFVLPLAAQKAPDNWFNLDITSDKVPGMSTERAYRDVLKGRTSRTVVVAVIDSGVDATHEDLAPVMWVNEDEIPNNGKDDDGNGYIDDINGWNFIGGANGESVYYDTYEATRVYGKLKPRFDGRTESTIGRKEKKDYALYLKLKADNEERTAGARATLAEQQGTIDQLMGGIKAAEKAMAGKPLTAENIDAIETGTDINLIVGKSIMQELSKMGEMPSSFADIYKMIEEEMGEGVKDAQATLQYHFNPDFDTRKTIVKDNYDNTAERNYGNNDVRGADAMHGTHVAGIIGAVRGNGKGMEGAADNVRIMSVLVVPPSGDERDKDVANAIYYAVDNGATVINMSFGKGYGSQKAAVDAAVKYAQANDVLIVHAAGNSSQNNDNTSNFPTALFQKKNGKLSKKRATNWLEIGAANARGGKSIAASFSNYGKKSVDLFSPGVQLYSTVPDSKYAALSGTSMASPAAAGTAAMLRSYFPNLTAEQVKSIMEQTVTPVTIKVSQPGTDNEVPMTDLCRTGGFVNAYEAAQLALKTQGKKAVVGSRGKFANKRDKGV